ncbi:MAG: glycosyltransferase family 4 protein [Bacteroidales bacterium]
MEIANRKRVIWLVNKHAAPMQYNATNLRTYKLAYFFNQMGFDTKILCSSFVHNRNINLIEGDKGFIEKEYDGVKYIFISGKEYKSNGVKRIFSLYDFARKVYKNRANFSVPDIIIHTTNIPFDSKIRKCAQLFKAKYIVEVVDLWPASFAAFGLMKESNPLMMLMYAMERKTYCTADKLVFSMEGGRDYIKDKKWNLESGGKIDLSKVYYLNNGVDVEDFDCCVKNYKIEDDDLADQRFKRIIYLGSIRLANDLIQLIKCAETLQHRSDIKFLIYGDGDDRQSLESYCLQHGLSNVIFKQKWIELKYVPYVLSQADVNIINYKANSIERYGGSQNKMFQALASGKPICSNVGMGYSIINQYKTGIDKRFVSSDEYANAILGLLELDSGDYQHMCLNARKAALAFDLKKLAYKYVDLF